jgi:hypothetical protein
LETLIGLKTPSLLKIIATQYSGSLIAPGIEVRALVGGGAEFTIEPGQTGALLKLFDDHANYGSWNFYGGESLSLRGEVERIPEVLTRSERFPFLVELDLDSILMGYVHPGANLDHVLLELGKLE